MLGVFTKTFSNNDLRTNYFEYYMDSLNRNTKQFFHFIYDDCSTDPKMQMLLNMQKVAKLEKNEMNRGVELQTKRVFEEMGKISLTDNRFDFFFHSDSDYIFAPNWVEETLRFADSNSFAVFTPFRREDGNEKKVGDFLDYVEVESFIGGAVFFPRAVMQTIYSRFDELGKTFQMRDWDFHLAQKLRSWGIPILATKNSYSQHIGVGAGENQPFMTTNFVGELPPEFKEIYLKLTQQK